MATVATLTIDLIGQSAKLQSELKKANKATQGWAKNTRASVNAVGKFMAGAGVAGAASLTAVYASAAKEADQLAKTADKLGVLPEALSGIQYAGELTGVSINTTNMALQRMTRRVAEAAQGTGEAVGALDELGINAERLAQLSPDQQFKVLADAMKDVSNQGDRVRLAMKLFDSEGVALVNTLKLGSEGLSAMQNEAEQLGLTLDRVELAKIEAANDNFHRAKVVTAAFGKTLAAEVSPLVGALGKEFAESAKQAGGFTNIVVNGVETVTTGVGFAADAVNGLKLVWKGVTLAVARAWEYSLAGLGKLETGIRHIIDLLPGVSVSTESTLADISTSFGNVADDIQAEFNSMALEKVPSEKIKEWVKSVQSTALEEAKANAASSASVLGEVSGVDAGGSTRSKAEEDAARNAFEKVRDGLMTEEEAVRESYARRREIILANTEENSLQQRELLKRLQSETDEELLELNGSFWERYLLAAEENLMNLDDLSASTIEQFSSGAGSALEKMVFDSESASDAFKGLAQDMARSTVAALGKMGAEWLAYKAVQLVVGKTAAAGSGAAMTAQAQAASMQAGINAFASTAAIPIVGPVLAPGAMAAALAATQPLAAAVSAMSAAAVASFDGGGYTGQGMRVGGVDGKGGFPAILHPNETVIDHTKGQGMGTVVNIHNYTGEKVEQRQNGNQVEIIVGRVKDAIRDDLNRGRDLANDFQSTYGLTRQGVV